MKRPIRTKDRKPLSREDAKATGNNFIFGVNPVVEALRSRSRRIDRIAIASNAGMHRMREILELAHRADLRVDRISPDQIERIAGNGANHQGVIAFVAAAAYSTADEVLENITDRVLLLLLDGVEDPRNLGAILRTAECAGVDGVFVPERRAVGLTETVAKSAAGATEHLRIAKVSNLNNQIAELKKQNIWVVGTTIDARMTHTEWDWTRPSALVLGGEGRGLHRLVAENCDVLVKIPMYGKIDSLNVSVAAGVILFEAQRQRAIADRERATGD
jgi:23S rRNA (guanosine2251-2'-O)-methyltransferase